MVLATSNKTKRLLCVSYLEQVRVGDLTRNQADIEALLAELGTDFRLLVDLSRLELMQVDCAAELGKFMELIDRSGVTMVVRVIPDPTKDIGMNILTAFHYRSRPQVITCETMTEAATYLSL
jgi:hypothetical protein